MKPYPKYKESGIEWIGEIPEHWEVKWLKHHFQFEKGKNAQLFTKEYIAERHGEYPVYSGQTENEGVMGIIDHYEYDTDETIFVTTVGAKAMTTRLVQGKYSLSQNCALVRPKHTELDVRYHNYLLTQIFSYEKGRISLIMQPSLRFEDLVLYKIIYPPSEEQQDIADYIDRKTALIDELVGKKRRQIELLKEQRQAVINQAATKGIDPNVEMKDSGIEWLGEIPEHWEVKKIFYVVEKITNGYVGPTRDIMKDSGIPYVQGIHIKNNTVKFTPDGFYYVSEQWSNEHSRSILKENDVLVVQTGSIGEVGIVPKELEGANCHALIILRAKRNLVIGKYLMRLLSSDFGFHSLFSIKTGDILYHLNATKVRDVKVPVPTIDEQAEVIDFIEIELSLIRESIDKAEKQIELLQEYRTALISEAVTGKIDVRDCLNTQ